MKEHSDSGYFHLACWTGILMLLPLVCLCFFSHPSSDDFPISNSAREWGSLTTVMGYYHGWTARYTSIFLMTINPVVFGWFEGYKLVPLLLIFALLSGLQLFFRGLWGNAGENRLGAVLFTLVFLYSMPDMPGGLYYLGGSLFYQPCNILISVLLGSLLLFPPPAGFAALPLKRWLMGFFQCLLLFLIAGSNEIGMMLGLVITGLGLVWTFYTEKKFSFGWLLLFLMSVTCALLILKAPATTYRMQSAGGFSRSYPEVALIAFQGMLIACGKWFSIPMMCLIILLCLMAEGRKPIPAGLTTGIKTLLSAGSMGLLYLCFIPSYLGEGVLQGHTENMLLFLFLLLICLNIRLWIMDTMFGRFNKIRSLQLFLACFFPLLFFCPGLRQALRDLVSGEAAAYSAECNARYRLMETTAGDTVRVPALNHKPASLFAGDIGDYPQPWYDNNFAALFGKKWVELDEKSKKAKQMVNSGKMVK